MTYWQGKRAVITGGSSGLGLALAGALVQRGARVAIVARRQSDLDQAAARLSANGGDVLAIAADVTSDADVQRMRDTVTERLGGIDVFCHCAGRSMRGEVTTTSVADFQQLWDLNFLAAVRGVHVFTDELTTSRGHIIFISSLAGRLASRYLGAYPASKFPLTALAQQLRLQLESSGVHTLLVLPGPIARDSSDERYARQAADLPAAASRPGGTDLRPIHPAVLSDQILRACERRQPELVVPAKTKLLFALSQLWPALGDRIVRRRTEQ
jgi:uncharacterized protein